MGEQRCIFRIQIAARGAAIGGAIGAGGNDFMGPMNASATALVSFYDM